MTALSIQPTYPIFTDIDGQPLEDGYVWVGVANVQPIGNPITVYWDAALTIPAAQPIRTRGGYPVNSGTPARLYVNSNYSIQVQNKNGSVVYSAPTATERYSDVVVSGVNAEEVIYDPPFAGGVATNVEAKLAQTASVTDFGAVGDGITDDTAAFQAAINTAKFITIPRGTFIISSALNIPSQTHIEGAGGGPNGTLLKLTAAGAGLYGVRTDGIELYNFGIDGGRVANYGIYIGAPNGQSSGFKFVGVGVNNCVQGGMYLLRLQYAWFENLYIFGTTNGYGITFDGGGDVTVTNSLILSNKTGMFLGDILSAIGPASGIYVQNCKFYGPYPSDPISPDGYLDIESSYNCTFENCTFEDEQLHTRTLVKITTPSANTTNNTFYRCAWLGIGYAVDLIEITGAAKTMFNQCWAIPPSGGKKILKNTTSGLDYNVQITDCYVNNAGYSTFNTVYWNQPAYVSSTGDNIFETRTAYPLVVQDYQNTRVGFNVLNPEYLFDVGSDHDNAPAGTQTVMRQFARNWNGVPGQEVFADALVYTSTSTLVGFNRGTRINTFNGVTTVGNCITGSAPDFPFSDDGLYAIRNTTVPATNNAFSLGNASFRWTEVFAINGVINTSDATEKQQVRSINDQERAVAQKLKGKMVAFKWNHAVEAKGDDARIHFGVLAQEVFAAFESEGLDASRYGIFCKDAWYKTENDQVVHLSEGEQAPDGVEVFEQYGVRYTELFAFIIAAM